MVHNAGLVVRKIVEVMFAEAKQATVGGHPEISAAIFDYAPDHIVQQAIFEAGIGHKAPVLEADKAGTIGANPQDVVRIFEDAGCRCCRAIGFISYGVVFEMAGTKTG